MGSPESTAAKPIAGKGSLDGLAQRLGALEESLTVVAGELGVSSVPKFKRLDPDSVYREAIRRAQEAVEPLRLALRKLDARLEEMTLAQTQMKRDIAAVRDDSVRSENLAGIDGQVAALAARLDATVMPIDQNESKLEAINETIARLTLRMDTIWERLDAQARAEPDRKTIEPDDSGMAQRLAALEHRLEHMANAMATRIQSAAAAQNANVEERLAAWQKRIAADIERRFAQLPASPAVAPPIDRDLIAAEVTQQIQTLIKEAAAQADPVPLMAEIPAERAPDLNPLVVSATERAIVRLTHRLEKLEEWRRQKTGGAGNKGGLMSRLFES